jgi:hypothetical protein
MPWSLNRKVALDAIHWLVDDGLISRPSLTLFASRHCERGRSHLLVELENDVANEIIRAMHFETWAPRTGVAEREMGEAILGAPTLAARPPGYLLPRALGTLYHHCMPTSTTWCPGLGGTSPLSQIFFSLPSLNNISPPFVMMPSASSCSNQFLFHS